MDLNKFNDLIDKIAAVSKSNAELQGESFNSYHRQNFISYMHKGIDLFSDDIKSYFRNNKEALGMSKEEIIQLLDESSRKIDLFERALFDLIAKVEEYKETV